MVGVGFAYLTMRENGKFQFATFAKDLTVFPSKRGRSQIMSMIDHLNENKKGKESEFDACMMRYKRYISSRSLIVIVSDFLYDLKHIEIPIYLFGGHNIKLIQVLDPLELDLKDIEGDYNLHDMETDESVRTYISPRMRSNYRSQLEEHIGKIKDLCNKTGVEFYTVNTSDTLFDSFYKCVQ
jgi:uncharacterized protein (DUF58 family)